MHDTRKSISQMMADLEFLRHSTAKITEHYQGQDVSTIEYFSLGLFHRLAACCAGLEHLLSELGRNVLMEHSAGIILRACLLDFLILFKAYDLALKGDRGSKSPEEIRREIDVVCKSVFADGLDQTMKFAERMKSAGYIDDTALEALYSKFAAKHAKFLEPHESAGKRPKIKSDYQARIAAGVLFTDSVDPENFHVLGEVYDLYMRYSKYDHYNIESLEIMLNDDIPNRIRRMHRAVEKLVVYNLACHAVIAEEDNPVNREFLKANSLEALDYRMKMATR